MFINYTRTSANLLLLCLALSHSRCSASSMPRKLHCLAQVNLKQMLDGVNAEGATIHRFHVEEFLDLDRRRSSVSLTDERTGDISIYYNKLNAQGDLSERKSILYEPSRSNCKSQRIIHWPLAELRKVAIYLHGLLSLGSKSIEDTPLGPSALVHAVELNPARFLFLEQILSKATLGYVNVFASQVEFRTLGGIDKIRVLVHMRANKQQTITSTSDTLADAFPPDESQSIAENLRFVGACRALVDGRATSGGVRSSLQEHDFCTPNNILFGVHFDVIEQHVEGTLIGRRLDESRAGYEFAREPHLQPVGIGCWDQDTNLGLQRSLLEGAAAAGRPLRLSAQSVSSLGPSGTTFVAYDGRAHLLRLERNGRVSVYDLAQAKVYHLVRAQGAQEPGKCVVLDVDGSSIESKEGSLVTARDHVLEQLVGLRPSGDEAHYLGTRVIDHQEYEVYEKELRLVALGLVGVPILLQAHRYKSPDSFKKRLLATYYTRAQVGAPELVSLHYIELWEFDPASKTRKLVNRVAFTEFTWSVGELMPTGGLETTGGTFDLAACRQDRAVQAQLKLAYVQDEGTKSAALTETHLRDNLRELSDRLQQVVADTLEVSRLNLANFEVAISTSGSANKSLEVVASGTLIEMHTGLSVAKFLGVARHDEPEMHKYAVRYLANRHSLEECKLDSIELGRKSNWLAYCAHLTLCVLLTPDGRLTEGLTHPLDDAARAAPTLADECRVYSLRYATLDQTSGRPGARLALESAQTNEIRLRVTPAELEIGYLDEMLGEMKTTTFRANLRTSTIEQLDPIGARLVNNVAALEGLSYSMISESAQQDGPQTPRTRNANFRWLAATSDDKPASILRHCQLACQLDEFCGSFSVCTSGTSAGTCILSPLRLAGERLSNLIEAKRVSRRQSFELRVPGVGSLVGEQTFVFEHLDGCNLHERDFLADFQATKSVDLSRAFTQVTAEQPEEARPTRDMEHEQHLTLDECAGLRFERSLGDSTQSESSFNFTYCPLESLCVLEGDEMPLLRGESTAELSRCLVYSRKATRAYERKTMTHLVVRPVRTIGESGAGARENARTSQAGDYKSRVTLRTFYTDDEEQCARECSLPSSGCLSLDICHDGRRKYLCLLYAIRSPMAKRGAYLPLLEHEQSCHANHNIVLTNNPTCNHFLLKRPFFETKLKHLLNREKMPTPSPKTLRELENKIELADDALSKQIHPFASNNGAKTIAAGGHAIEGLHYRLTVRFSVGSIYTVLLAVGLVIGSLGAAYKQPLKNAAGNLYLWAQLTLRPTQRDITPLVTRNQL